MRSESKVFVLIAAWSIATYSNGIDVDKQKVYKQKSFDDMSFEEKDEETMNKGISYHSILSGDVKSGIRDTWEGRDLVDDKSISRKKRSPRASSPYRGDSYNRNTQWGNILGRGFKMGRRSDDNNDNFDDYIEKRRLGLVLGNGLLTGTRPDNRHGHHQSHQKTNTVQRDSSSYPNSYTRTSPNHTGRHGHNSPNLSQSNSNYPASRIPSNSYPAQRSSANNVPPRPSSYNSGYAASPQNPNSLVHANGYNRINGQTTAQRNSYDTGQRRPSHTPQRTSYNLAQRSVQNSPQSNPQRSPQTNPHNSPLNYPYNARQINSYNPHQRTYPYNVYVDPDDLYDSDEYERRRAQQMLSQVSRSLPNSNVQPPNYLLPYKTYRTYIDNSGEVETDSVEVYPNPYASRPSYG